MDQDQQCVAPDDGGTSSAPVSTPDAPTCDDAGAASAAPAVDGAGGAGGAPGVGNAGGASAGGPTTDDILKFDNNMGDALGAVDALGTVGKVAKDTGELAGKVGGLLALPNDAKTTYDGIDKGEYGKAAIGAAGVVGDVASVAGASGVASVAGAVKGGLELGKGAEEIYNAATAAPLAPGQSGASGADTAVNGVEDVLTGVGDVGAALPGAAGAVGKSFKAGMAVGNLIAPVVFSGDSSVKAPEDDKYYGTTGNSWVDWVAGVGKYSVSRWPTSNGGAATSSSAPSSESSGGGS